MKPLYKLPVPSVTKKRVRTLEELRPYVRQGYYRIAAHARDHAFCEGFTEDDIRSALLYGKEMVRYLEDERLLVLSYICLSPTIKIPLHVIAEYSKPRWVDVITAFVPKNPHRFISRTRLAEFLRHDTHKKTKISSTSINAA